MRIERVAELVPAIYLSKCERLDKKSKLASENRNGSL